MLAFDQTTELIHRGPSTGFDEEKVRRILLRGAMRATDFGAALHALAADGSAKRRVLVVTDGILIANDDGLPSRSAKRLSFSEMTDKGYADLGAVKF